MKISETNIDKTLKVEINELSSMLKSALLKWNCSSSNFNELLNNQFEEILDISDKLLHKLLHTHTDFADYVKIFKEMYGEKYTEVCSKFAELTKTDKKVLNVIAGILYETNGITTKPYKYSW